MKDVFESNVIGDENIFNCIYNSCKNKDKILDFIKCSHIDPINNLQHGLD